MREKIGTYEAYDETIKRLGDDGLLLVSGEMGNPMTIGWATVGIIWGLPIMVVLVRPSRYTFGLMETTKEFTVNVPTPGLKKEVAVCGSKSGRDMDKIKECGFKLGKSQSISIPYIEECPIHYECKVVHKNDVLNSELDPKILKNSYPSGDLHRMYYGEILGVYRETGR